MCKSFSQPGKSITRGVLYDIYLSFLYIKACMGKEKIILIILIVFPVKEFQKTFLKWLLINNFPKDIYLEDSIYIDTWYFNLWNLFNEDCSLS